MALVTLTEYKRAIKETDAANDQFHQDAVDAASEAIINYCNRDFGTAVVTGDKSYWYNGSGILDIADADTVHTVTLGTQASLPNTSWIAKTEGPPQVPVYTYLELPKIDWSSGRFIDSAGVMGFTRNLDTFLATSASAANREIMVTVNADFGWAIVPVTVKRATILTASHLETITPSGGQSGDLSSHSVAEVSESFFGVSSGAESASEAIPATALALLNPYVRGAA